MATGQINRVIHHIRRAALLHEGSEMTDGQMLERFLLSREEAAFEGIVRRHGPMVLAVYRQHVCRTRTTPRTHSRQRFWCCFARRLRWCRGQPSATGSTAWPITRP